MKKRKVWKHILGVALAVVLVVASTQQPFLSALATEKPENIASVLTTEDEAALTETGDAESGAAGADEIPVDQAEDEEPLTEAESGSEAEGEEAALETGSTEASSETGDTQTLSEAEETEPASETKDAEDSAVEDTEPDEESSEKENQSQTSTGQNTASQKVGVVSNKTGAEGYSKLHTYTGAGLPNPVASNFLYNKEEIPSSAFSYEWYAGRTASGTPLTSAPKDVGTYSLLVKVAVDAESGAEAVLKLPVKISKARLEITVNDQTITEGEKISSRTSDVTISADKSLVGGDALESVELKTSGLLHRITLKEAVITNGGEDVSGNYQIRAVAGKVTVNERTTATAEAEETESEQAEAAAEAETAAVSSALSRSTMSARNAAEEDDEDAAAENSAAAFSARTYADTYEETGKIVPDLGTVYVVDPATIYTTTKPENVILGWTNTEITGTIELTTTSFKSSGRIPCEWEFVPSGASADTYYALNGYINLDINKDDFELILDAGPTKTSYEYGEEFNRSGLRVIAQFTYGAPMDVTNDVEYGKLNADDTSIELSYTWDGDTRIVTVNGLTVSPREVTATVAAKDKEYDGTDTAEVYVKEIGEMVGDEELKISGLTGTFISANASDYPIKVNVEIGGAKVEGVGDTKPENYNITYDINNVSAHITRKPVTITGIYVDDHTYDGDSAVNPDSCSGDPEIVGIISKDVAEVKLDIGTGKYLSLKFADADGKESADAGTKYILFSGYSLTGSAADNYKLVEKSGITATILKRKVIVTGITAKDKTYDGKTAAELDYSEKIYTVKGAEYDEKSVSELVGLAEEELSVIATGTFESADAGNSKKVSITNVNPSGDKAGNYEFPADDQQQSTTASISKANIDNPTPASLNVRTNKEYTYTYDLLQLLPTLVTGQSFGNVSYETSASVTLLEDYAGYTATVKKEGSNLKVTIPKVASAEGVVIGIIRVTLTSTNFEFTTPRVDIPIITIGKVQVNIEGASVQSKYYDGQPITFTPATGTTDDNVRSATLIYTWYDAETGKERENRPEDAGSYKLVISVPDSNEDYTGTLELPFEIYKAVVTITADNKTAGLNDPVPELTYTVSGLYGSDELLVEPTLSYQYEPVMSQEGQYNIVASGAAVPDTGNYEKEITYVDGVLTVGVVPATGVTLDRSTAKLSAPMVDGVYSTLQLKATVSPANARDKSVTWSSSKTSVATVDSDGVVTAKAVGTTVITATTVDIGYTAHCTVTVNAVFDAVEAAATDEDGVALEVKVQAEKGLSVVPKLLEDTGFNTVEMIESALKTEVTQNGTYSSANTAVYELVLFIRNGDGDWVKADEDDFPTGGLSVTLPYPSGTNQTAYDFTVVHMFATGNHAGTMETPAVTKLEDGIQFMVTGLSPVIVAWKSTGTTLSTTSNTGTTAATSSSTSSDSSKSTSSSSSSKSGSSSGTTSGTSGTSGTTTTSSSGNTTRTASSGSTNGVTTLLSVKTGDGSPVGLYLVLLAFVLVLTVLIVRRRRR